MNMPLSTFFSRATGGPTHDRSEKVSENEFANHALDLRHRRFATNALFVYFAPCMIETRPVNGVTAAVMAPLELQSVLFSLYAGRHSGTAISLEMNIELEQYV